jgi:hypothetical protein
MTKKYIFFVLITLLFSACSSGIGDLFSKERKNYPAPLINLRTLLTDSENDVSFPIWFNDSIIKAQKIFKVTRKMFPRNNENNKEYSNINSTVPREIREFYFDRTGSLIQLNVHNYYDDREIGSILFSYSGKKDFYGYSEVKHNKFISKTANPFSEEEQLDPEVRELDFRMHIKRKSYNKCLVYQDMETGDYLFYLPNRKYWRPMAVDSLVAPNPKDLVVWGKPKFVSKKYQVSNKVNEKNVKLFTYFKKHPKVLKYWVKKDYPFDHKRDFIYSKKGICTGFIDSTFSEDLYVTRVVSEIQYNKNKLPKRIIHRKQNPSNETEFFSLEIFEYEKMKPASKK